MKTAYISSVFKVQLHYIWLNVGIQMEKKI